MVRAMPRCSAGEPGKRAARVDQCHHRQGEFLGQTQEPLGLPVALRHRHHLPPLRDEHHGVPLQVGNTAENRRVVAIAAVAMELAE